MSKSSNAAKEVIAESNPVTFVQRLRGMPVLKQVFRVLDRFL